MCGEHHALVSGIAVSLGSSPHVRGTRWRSFSNDHAMGIIPACAGNTRHCRARLGYSGDHPRMCGEHNYSEIETPRKPGSSPHVRGTPAYTLVADSLFGIIPACAGNTRKQSGRLSGDRDHPRMCGEHQSLTPYISLSRGSSPHVRGTLVEYTTTVDESGIIPACAGNTD